MEMVVHTYSSSLIALCKTDVNFLHISHITRFPNKRDKNNGSMV